MDGLPSCFPGWGGGPASRTSVFPATAPAPGEPVLPADVVFVDVLEVLVVVAVALLVGGLVKTLVPMGCDPSPVTCESGARKILENVSLYE